MPRHTRNFRPPFDGTLAFVVLRGTKVNGVPIGAGDPFDKSSVSARRLEQLFEARTIGYAHGQTLPDGRPRARPSAVGPTDLLNPGEAGHALPARDGAKRAGRKGATPRLRSRRAA